MNRTLKILHLEDVATDAELVSIELKRANIIFDKLVVDMKQDYIDAISEFVPDVILSDHTLPAFNSLEALNILKESGLSVPFILVTGTTSEEFAVDIMKAGAADYIFKDRIQRLPSAVLNSIEKFQLQAETESAYLQLLEASATQVAILNALPPNIALLNEKGLFH
jgi:DNA-binding NtrC family response regulator